MEKIGQNLQDVLDWWTHHHCSGHSFSFTSPLPTTPQTDFSSCGILAYNALTSHLLDDVSLLEMKDIVEECLRIFLQVVEWHKHQVRHFLIQDCSKTYHVTHNLFQQMQNFSFTCPLTSSTEDEIPPTGTSLNVPSTGNDDVEIHSIPDTTVEHGTSPSILSSHSSTLNSPPARCLSSSCSSSSDLFPSPLWISKAIPSLKRSRSPQISSPTANKKPIRRQITSNIRSALDLAKETGSTAKKGILQFFKKATSEEKETYKTNEFERLRDKIGNCKFAEEQVMAERNSHQKELAAARQRKRRTKIKEAEISKGIRSPGGTKRKVRNYCLY